MILVPWFPTRWHFTGDVANIAMIHRCGVIPVTIQQPLFEPHLIQGWNAMSDAAKEERHLAIGELR